ncbi:DUF599 domain-containing protein [Actimicrobium sp. CCC2.4]|uniref:DUF599 domain-containing protein n=1 Tax=Actimicrobium sp. CCC2.4 TaxID=3048606 RepID=UPI002AC99DEF|nr:DUF599 domain-containing protein [Actimicrobium sp. CCC2.4]MEB0135119.1 DUF599 domain-containing protein [Actimicrobium sp. CCC2.4]WPX31836.1 DUF599 domain-containing protein [Actimicrobium sp. CCC2.4]
MEMWFSADLLALLSSVTLLLAYYGWLYWQVRRSPDYSIHRVNQTARGLWVRHVMSTPGLEVLAIQTLRNLSMAATFKGSSAALLILGTLTLSGQSENLGHTWHALNPGLVSPPGWWTIKILCLLTALIIAFFAFAMTIRMLNHVMFMINLPACAAVGTLSPVSVARRLNRAGSFYSIGMRALFGAIPLAFWLFGSVFFVGATAGLVLVLFMIDRNRVGT